jgi:apolipoprotein N-acyltransferase
MLETMGKAHGWGTLPKCRAKLLFHLIISLFFIFFKVALLATPSQAECILWLFVNFQSGINWLFIFILGSVIDYHAKSRVSF